MRSIIPFVFVPACYAVPYAEHIYAPSLRALIPLAAVGINGSVTALASPTDAHEIRPAVFNGPSSVTFHFQKNVAGDSFYRRRFRPGDISISLEAIGVSTYDLHSVRVALELLLGLKKEDGRLLYASPPFADTVSFTYHCHSLNGLALYYFYSGDLDWLSRYWNHFKLGIDYALLSVDATAWLTSLPVRAGCIWNGWSSNPLLYNVLSHGLNLATVLNQASVQHRWTTKVIPAHVNVNGNEFADEEAKSAEQEDTSFIRRAVEAIVCDLDPDA